MYDQCPECNILSENLSKASKDYFAILEKRQLAQSENNSAGLSLLESLTVAAAEKRGKARQRLRQHQATHPMRKAQTA